MINRYLNFIAIRPKLLFSIYSILFIFSFIIFLTIDFNTSNYKSRPGLNISTSYPGVDAFKIEEIITDPIEDAISAIGGIKEIRSFSEYGKSSIQIEFEDEKSIKIKSMQIREKIDLASSFFPKESHRPIVSIFDPDQIPILVISFNSEQNSINEIRNAVEKTIKPEIEGIDGVTQAIVGGGNIQEIVIACDPQKLQAYSLSLRDIVNTINSYNLNSSLGKLFNNKILINISSINRKSNIKDISKIPIFSKAQNKVVLLTEIASISFSDRDDEIGSRINAENRVSLFVYKSFSANPTIISNQIINTLKKNKLQNIDFQIIQDEGESINSVKYSIYILLILLICFLFFLNFKLKKSYLFLSSIILTYLYNFIILTVIGSILNIKFNDNFAIIIILSNLYFYFDIAKNSKEIKTIENSKFGRSIDLNLHSNSNLSLVIIYSLLIVFASIFIELNSFVSIKKISILFLLSYLFNLLVFNYFFYAINRLNANKTFINLHKGFISNLILNLHLKIKKFILKSILNSNKKLLMNAYLIPIALCFMGIYGIYSLITFEANKSSKSNNSEIIGFLEYPSGTSYDYTNKSSLDIEKKIKEFPGVTTIISRIDPGHTLYIINLEEGRVPSKEFQKKLKSHIGPTKDGYLYFFNREDKNLDEVTFDLIGTDITEMETIVFEIIEDFKYRKGINEAVLRFKPSREEMIFLLDTEKFKWSKFNFSDFSDQLRIAIQGSVASKIIYDGQEIDIRVRYDDKFRSDIESLRDYQLKNSNQDFTSIIEIAKSKIRKVPVKIYHKNKQRSYSFTIRFLDIYPAGMNGIIDELLKKELPENYRIEVNSDMSDSGNDDYILFYLVILNTIVVILTISLNVANFNLHKNHIIILFLTLMIPFIFFRWVPDLGNLEFYEIYLFYTSIWSIKFYHSQKRHIFQEGSDFFPLVILLFFISNELVSFFSLILLLTATLLTMYWIDLNYVSWRIQHGNNSFQDIITPIRQRIALLVSRMKQKNTPK